MNQSPEPGLLLVVGMHRSGTSALCAALHASGASFGTSLLDPMSGVNDEGFWEDEAVVALNERLLEQLGYHWYSVPVGLRDSGLGRRRLRPDAGGGAGHIGTRLR